MEKSIDIAAQNFLQLHKAGFLDVDHIEDRYGSVAGFLSTEGKHVGDLGKKDIEIKAHEHKDGRTATVEWFEDTFQIGYFRLPTDQRVTPEDHTPELDFSADFDFCIDRIKELKADGFCGISLYECSEGEYVSEIRIEDYIDGWDAA